ncbi:hypothetical protein H0A36_25990 [Endozoicomonas sp. SM1973]|uniref:Uncharacterized protein n=1 Tax=Spartinivicinus marinus TaxID=2994442 RepID=A0A853IC95_9GAMM|nr:hypothetical protein [Spartinivicinus marinus]NYZ69472.1 hypothetical protein [Spartinivicinus marinus]
MNSKNTIELSSIKCTRIASMLRLLSELDNNSMINVNDFADTAFFLAQQLDEIANTLDATTILKH